MLMMCDCFLKCDIMTCPCSRAFGVRVFWPFPCLVSCWLMGTWGTTNWASCLSTCGTSATNTATVRPGCLWVHLHSSFETVSLDRTAVLTPSSLLQVRTLESIKQQAQQHDMTHLTDVVQRLALQSRTWTLASCQEHLTTEKRRKKMPYCVFWGVNKHFEYVMSSNICHQLLLKPVPKPLIHKQKSLQWSSHVKFDTKNIKMWYCWFIWLPYVYL